MRCWLWPEMCWCKNPPACILRRQSRRYYRVVGRRARLWSFEIIFGLALAGWIAYCLTAQPERRSVIFWHGMQACIVEYQNGGYITSFGSCPRTDDQRYDRELFTVQRI